MSTTEQVLAKLEPWRAKHTRSAWKPIVEVGESSATSSKFGGTPWTSSDYPWPICKNCQKQMQFFLQLNLAEELPLELQNAYGTGLLQLFYCTRGECEGMGGWEAFEDLISCVRVVQIADNYAPPVELHAQEVEFTPKQVIGWEHFEELPSPEEHEEFGLEYVYDHKAHTVKLKCKSPAFETDFFKDPELAETIGNPEPGDKLGGWPHWIQSAEYPYCPKCQAQMVLVLQVDSEDNIPYMFGDSGCGHIMQCPEHKDVVGFGWACC